MLKVYYIKTARTGGGASALDGIDGATLNDGDVAFVIETDRALFYENDADGALSEVDPFVIVQDANPGANCWKLKGVMNKLDTTFQEKTISSGAVTLTGPGNYDIDTEGDAAADDLTSILGLAEGEEATLRPENSARTVNVINNSSIILAGIDFTMDSQNDAIRVQGMGSNVVRECWRIGGGS